MIKNLINNIKYQVSQDGGGVAIFVSVNVIVFTYYIFRPQYLSSFLFILLITTLVMCFIKLRINKKFLIVMLIIAGLTYLIYSYFNTRISSYDGLNFHLKYILLIWEKGYVATTEYPIKPYLGELLLSYIYKNFGLRILNLTFGIFSIINIWLAYYLIKSLAQNNSVKNFAFLIFILSPSFLGMATRELKTDLISLMLVLSGILLYMKSIKGRYILLPLVGLFSGIAIVVKTSTSIMAIGLLIIGNLVLIRSSLLQKHKLLISIISVFLFLTPIIGWTIKFGGTIPQLENYINIKSHNLKAIQRVTLERDRPVLSKCNEDKLKKDYSSFVYGSRSVLVLAQPLFYISRFNAYPFSSQSMANPGILIYFSIILLLLSPIFYKRLNLTGPQGYLYWISFATTTIFMIFISSIFWYLLFLFPLLSTLFASLIYRIKNIKLKKITLIICYSAILTDFLFATIIALKSFNPISDLSYSTLRNSTLKKMYEMNMKIDQISKTSLFLDASEHGGTLLTTFVPHGDTRIVKSNYYFAASKKNLEGMRTELLINNINYILINKNNLRNKWYTGCPLENNLKLEEFIKKYTVPVYPNDPIYKDLFFKILQ